MGGPVARVVSPDVSLFSMAKSRPPAPTPAPTPAPVAAADPEPEIEAAKSKEEKRRALGQGRAQTASVRRQRSVLGDPANVQKKTLLGG